MKPVLGALIAVLALSAIASASASASACTKKAGSKNYQLCINGSTAEAKTYPTIVGSGGKASLNLEKLYAPGDNIACEQNGLARGKFLVPGTSPVSLAWSPTFSGCALTGELGKKCITSRSDEFKALVGALASTETIVVSAEAGSIMAEIEIDGEICPSVDTWVWSFRGQYECSIHEAGVELVAHEVKCKSSAAHETYVAGSGDTATPLSYTQTMKLASGEKFSIYEAK